MANVFLILQHLGAHFGIEQPRVSVILEKVSTLLDIHFVPQYYGIGHFDRSEILENHLPTFIPKLLGTDIAKPVFIMDGVNFYISRPSDHKTQKLTYSGQKKMNLYKAMACTLPTGRCVMLESVFWASNNDARMTSYLLEEGQPLDELMRPGDVVLDRGFNDVLPQLEARGLQVFMPSFLAPNQGQFTQQQADENRKVITFIMMEIISY